MIIFIIGSKGNETERKKEVCEVGKGLQMQEWWVGRMEGGVVDVCGDYNLIV